MKRFLFAVLAMTMVSKIQAADFVMPEDLQEVRELPDLFSRLDGSKVTNADGWRDRAAELVDLMQRGMYGRMPGRPGAMKVRVLLAETNCSAGGALMSEVALEFGKPSSPPIHVLMVRPSNATKPVPAFLGINFNGNQSVLPDAAIRLTTNWVSGVGNKTGVVNNRMTEAGRGAEASDWFVGQIVQRGYAFVTFHCADIEPDRPDAKEGTRAAYPSHDWGAIAAWSWGFHRVMDHLTTVKAVDAKRVAAVGWSRNGKAALLATALDSRIAMVFPHQAGCGGTAPSRHWIGGGSAGVVETIERINTAFPHWFNADFKNFAKQPERLPFDQHALVAACAPRPVCFTTATEDRWSNPPGQFEVLKAASKVYELIEAGKLDAEVMPNTGQPSISGRLGFFYRIGTHSLNFRDWEVMLDFADRHLPKAEQR